MVLTDEQHKARIEYLVKNYPGRSYSDIHFSVSEKELEGLFAEDEVRTRVNKTLSNLGISTGQAAAGPSRKKVPNVIETIASKSGIIVHLLPVWQAQRHSDGTLAGGGNGGTAQGSGPIPDDLSYWYCISFMQPRVVRYVDKTMAALEEVLNPVYETAAVANGFHNWNGLDYTGENDKNYIELFYSQFGGGFNWGGGTNSGSVPVKYSMFNGGLPLQGAGGMIMIQETISEYPGDATAGGQALGFSFYCPARSGLRITSTRPGESIGIGMQKTPDFKKSLLRRGVGLGPGTEQRQRIPGERSDWEALQHRGFLNVDAEFKHPDWKIHNIGPYDTYLDFGIGANGDERIYCREGNSYRWLGSVGQRSWHYDSRGRLFCADLAKSLVDARWQEIFGMNGREDASHGMSTYGTGVQGARTHVIGPCIQQHVHDMCLPPGPNSGRESKDRNPCAWPGGVALPFGGFAGHYGCLNLRHFDGEPWDGTALGSDTTKFHEITWLRGRTMKYVAETPDVRTKFINELLTDLGRRDGIFHPSKPGMGIMGGAQGQDGGVAELYRTDKYKIWVETELQPIQITGALRDGREVLNNPAYPTDGYWWTPDP